MIDWQSIFLPRPISLLAGAIYSEPVRQESSDMQMVKSDGNSVVRVIDVAEPKPEPGEVVIRMVHSALCGSEMSAYRKTGAPGNVGHEAAGIVLKIGDGVSTLRPGQRVGVSTLRPGQRVGVSAIAGCGSCAQCKLGRYTWCDRLKFFCNMHAEQFVIPALACHPLPDDVPWDVGVLISGDGLGVPYHTSLKLPPETQTIAIFGMGPIGLGNTLLQAHLGRTVIALDVVQWRLDFAKQLGAAHIITASDANVVEQIKNLTAGNGVDVAIEAAGRPESTRQCFQSVRKGGMVVFNGEQAKVELSPSDDFIRRDITAVGSWFYHFHEFKPMLELYRSGLNVAKLVSHRMPLSQAAEAFSTFAAGQAGKVMLTVAP
jgi:propanol-preferring alcohol dehydrogenase